VLDARRVRVAAARDLLLIEAELQLLQRAVFADDHASEGAVSGRRDLDAIGEHRARERRERLDLRYQRLQ
jgi:hypothetical protein